MIKKVFTFLKIILSVLAVLVFIFIAIKLISLNENYRRYILGEETASNPDNFKSEDYEISRITLGGDIGLYMSDEDRNAALDLYNLKSEVYAAKDKDETRMLLSWNSSKSSIADIDFSKKGEALAKTIVENGFSLNHAVILSNLEPDSVYTYKIRSRDRWGYEKVSEEYAFYTGAPNVSLLDVLRDAVEKLFGWALNGK